MKYVAIILLALAGTAPAQPPSWDTVVHYAVQSGESTWRNVQTHKSTLTSIEIYRYALALCEAGEYPDRLETLFETGAQMQDRDPGSRGYGNFHWYASETAVNDYNAVDFCMQPAALIWLRYRDVLPEKAAAILKETLDFAVQGCMRHGVPESYTNIAYMNAGDLILLGEATGRPDVAQEGYRRLDLAAAFTWRYGTHEYDSPTYYGVDLDDLGLIERFAAREHGRDLARTLLDLFWTDIALNWYPPAQKLTGPHSRSYDYLRGLGSLDTNLWVEGWIAGAPRGGTGALFQALAQWHPADSIKALSEQFPRQVRQSWDVTDDAARTNDLQKGVTLGTAGAIYGAQDIPLAFDFPGPRESVRGYFIPDARHDPYGTVKIAAGNHQKALHLTPYWRAAQRGENALGLVRYRDGDLPQSLKSLESHLVMPLDVDEIWVGDRRVSLTAEPDIAIAPGQAVVVRKGAAAVGIRIPWARDLNGAQAPIHLVYDHNAYGAMRLTVDHLTTDHAVSKAGAAFWVRAGDDLDDAAFKIWRQQFEAALPLVETASDRLTLTVPGKDGAVRVQIPLTGETGGDLYPVPSQAVLEDNGQDLGRSILNRLAWIGDMVKAATPPLIALPGIQRAYWEAEQGAIVPPMVPAQDADASGGAYVWMPGIAGAIGGSDLGAVTWRLQVPKAGTYYLWGRVRTPTPQDDSFYIRLYTAKEERIPKSAWHTGQHATWTWVAVHLNQSETPTPFDLPEGEVTLECRVREDGAALDRLYLTPDPSDRPSDLSTQPRGSADFNGDRRVDFADFVLFAHAYGSTRNTPGYSEILDLNGDGNIDFSDFVLFAGAFGTQIS